MPTFSAPVDRPACLPPADLGLARIYQAPLQPLVLADRVVVTIWYRAPELLLGAKHYTKTIGRRLAHVARTAQLYSLKPPHPPFARPATRPVDLWSIGCIFAELLLLHSPFKGKEVKAQANNRNPFQRNQLEKIFEYLGLPGRTATGGTRPRPGCCRRLKPRLGRTVDDAAAGDRWSGVKDLPEFGQLNSFNKRSVHAWRGARRDPSS